MNVVLNNGKTFKKLIDALTSLIDATITFYYDEKEINIFEMDASHTTIAEIVLGQSMFERFDVEKTGQFSVNAQTFKLLLKRVNEQSKIKLKIKGDEDDKIFVTIYGKNGIKNKYDVKLMNVDSDRLEIPEVDYLGVATFDAAGFYRVLSNLHDINGDVTEILVGKKEIKFIVSNDNMKLKIIPESELCKICLNRFEHDEVSFNFATKYLIYAQNFLEITEGRSKISFMNDFPLAIDMKIKTGKDANDSKIYLHIAPRIDD